MMESKKQHLLVLLGLLLFWTFFFADALISMESIWRRSDTFAHGYFILPIVIWLFWRDKTYLINSQFETSWIAILPAIGSFLLYMIAYAADIDVLAQLSAVIGLVSIIWLVLGNRLTLHYKFPLAYLIFLVPMGENLIPQLQDITAWFTVEFLKFNGIPVFRDGLYIQIPAGLFEVAVACSGIRYLIASLAVGTLFAYLSYRSFYKQLVFTLFAFFLPILANGIRAYLIVAIAHYSDMEYATGADHLVYGWVFFGFVIMLMFWVGGKFTDPEITNEELRDAAIKQNGVGKTSYLAISSIFVLFISFYLYKHSIQVVNTGSKSLSAITSLSEVNDSNWGINYKHARYVSHVKSESGIETYRAVYANKQSKGELISQSNRLFNHERWTIADRVGFQLDGHQAHYLLLRNTLGKERLVVYWYQVGDDYYISPSNVKLQQALSLLQKSRAFAQVVAFSIEGDAGVEALLSLIEKETIDIEQHFVEPAGIANDD